MIFLNIRGSFLFLCIVVSTHVTLAQMDYKSSFSDKFCSIFWTAASRNCGSFLRGPKKPSPNIFILPVSYYKAVHFHRYLVIVSWILNPLAAFVLILLALWLEAGSWYSFRFLAIFLCGHFYCTSWNFLYQFSYIDIGTCIFTVVYLCLYLSVIFVLSVELHICVKTARLKLFSM